MVYRDILTLLNAYPAPTGISALERVADFAAQSKASLTCWIHEADIVGPANPLVRTVLNVPAIVGEERAKCLQNVSILKEQVRQIADRRGIALEVVVEKIPGVEAPEAATDHARLHDLTIIPIDPPHGFPAYLAEGVIFGAGRPCLLLPAAAERSVLTLERIAIAWDFSRPAARALSDAMPLLANARSVSIVTVINEKEFAAGRPVTELQRHLSDHGIIASADKVDANGRRIGETLTTFAAENQIDLLVMGAYGHSRFRDFILGGATKYIVADPPLPVLLSH